MKQLNSDHSDDIMIHTRINSSDDLMLVLIAADTINEDWTNDIHLYLPYMPYQQADRKFAEGECFSLRTVTRMLNHSPIKTFTVFDPHSEVTAALLRHCTVKDNSEFVKATLSLLSIKYGKEIADNLTLVSPDAGAYKKIFKLAEKIGFKGAIETANKYRDTSNGELQIRLSKEDFEGKDILIIDDICVGGRTFTALADVLLKCNVGRLFLAVSHGIFSNGLVELGTYFSDIFTTNSRRPSYEEEIQKVSDCQFGGENGPALYKGKPVNFNYSNRPFQLHAYEVI